MQGIAYRLSVVILALSMTACSQLGFVSEEKLEQNPEQMAQQYLIVDTHIDVPHRLLKHYEDVGHATEKGEFDYPRALAGGLNVPFMSIYVPAKVDEQGKAKAHADKLIDMMEKLVADHPSKFALAYSTDAALENFDKGLMSLALGMENGGPIAGDFNNLQHFYDRGIRYITLAHGKSNHISDSSYDENRQWQGLSPFGKKLIPEMNRIGMMIDISHVSDEAFYDVIARTKAPVIASHSSARHFVKDFERNMSDDMLKVLARNGGVMQLNIGSTFLSQAARDSRTEQDRLAKAKLETLGLDKDSEQGKRVINQIREEHPFVYADMSHVLDHVDHVVQLVGIEHIGLGSDFDGVGDTLPIGFKDASQYPNFIAGLLSRGYSKHDIKLILGGNIMRVWREVEAYAKVQAKISQQS